MVKHARKRQKTLKTAAYDDLAAVPTKAARLEMLMDEEAKDDEERKLESMLFGVKYMPRGVSKGKGKDMSGDEDENENEDVEGLGELGGREMQHLQDQDLFYVDDGAASNNFSHPDLGLEDSDAEQDQNSESDSHPSDSDSDSSSSSTSARKSTQRHHKSLIQSKSKPPAWTDPSDAQPTAHVSLLSGPARLRKLRQAVGEDEISGLEYETRLRSQFERINPEPTWARKARKGSKRKDDGDESEDGVEDLWASTTGILADGKKKRGPVVIPQGTLELERVRDANQSVQGSGSGEVRVLAFHPKPSVPVLCVATADRRVRLFSIDGHLSPLLTTIHMPTLPLTSPTSALFHPQGNSMLLSGPRPFFYTYDLQQGTSTLHRRGLWGSGSSIFDDSAVLSTNNGKRRKRGQDTTLVGGKDNKGGLGGGGNTSTLTHTAFSPGTGSMLAVAGKGGEVHLVDWKSGAGQVVGSLKCTSGGGGGGGGIQGLWWVPGSTSEDSALGMGTGGAGGDSERHLAVLTGEAEVYIWDVAQRRCVRRWRDEGGYRGAGRVLAGGGSASGGWMGIGSSSGFVNVYGSDSFSIPDALSTTFSSSSSNNPKLVKALGHLTTPISTLRFNHDAQILAMASKEKKDALRLVHLPSLTAFGNWPTSSTPLGHVTAVDFAAGSEYVAVGNTRGRVLLYHLRGYGAGA
ncbi:WD40-repeat-containing domain protein [Crassisporium funariophilum]|nr:WD40-repeat-containing domain protein [Crassisporium funariophilum]